MGLNTSENTSTGFLLLPFLPNYSNGNSTLLAPDLAAKVAVEPGWGHFKIKAIGPFFRTGSPPLRVRSISQRSRTGTFCDLRNHKVYDVVLGRSELALDSYLTRIPDKDQVEVICTDRSPAYRAVARKRFSRAPDSSGWVHVIGIVNHHFLTCSEENRSPEAKNRCLLFARGDRQYVALYQK